MKNPFLQIFVVGFFALILLACEQNENDDKASRQERQAAQESAPAIMTDSLTAMSDSPSAPVSISGKKDSSDLWDTSSTYGYIKNQAATGIERGREVYNQWCAICHAEGVGMAGTDSLKRFYKMQGITDLDPVLANRMDLDAETIKHVTRNGIKSMPNFRKTEISDADLDLIVLYLTRHQSAEQTP